MSVNVDGDQTDEVNPNDANMDSDDVDVDDGNDVKYDNVVDDDDINVNINHVDIFDTINWKILTSDWVKILVE